MSRRTRDPSRRDTTFGYRAFTFYGGPFQTSSPNRILCTPCETSHNPKRASSLVWANPRSLAATDGITIVFSSSGYLDVSVPWVCLYIQLCIHVMSNCVLPQLGFPIRTSPDQSLLTAPRGISLFATSFFGS